MKLKGQIIISSKFKELFVPFTHLFIYKRIDNDKSLKKNYWFMQMHAEKYSLLLLTAFRRSWIHCKSNNIHTLQAKEKYL